MPISSFTRFRTLALLTATCGVLFGTPLPAEAGTIERVNQQTFNCIKNNPGGRAQGGYLVYPSGNSGTISLYVYFLGSASWAGSVDFNYSPQQQALTFTNHRGIHGHRIEGGVRTTAEQCR
jgi:hypothetical protein